MTTTAFLALSILGANADAPRDTTWLALDRELANLSEQHNEAPAVRVWGYVRTAYTNGDFDLNNNLVADAGPPAEADISGFRLQQVRPYFEAKVGDYTALISVECASGAAILRHAYAQWKCNEHVTTTMGQFKQPFLRTFMLPDHKVALIDRTHTAALNAATGFQPGVMANGKAGRFGWFGAAQNGADGTADEFLFTGKVTFDVLGQGLPLAEGALAAREEADCTVGVGFADDGGAVDGDADGDIEGSAMLFEAGYNQKPFSVQAEMVDLDEDLGNRTPWSVTAGFMIAPEKWELLGRYEDMDDALETTRITVGANYYVKGHDVKWQFDGGTSDANTGGVDGSFFQFGLTVAF